MILISDQDEISDEIFWHSISTLKGVKMRGGGMEKDTLGVVSFHGNGEVWKGLLAFTVPVVCNIHNWPGLMRRRVGNRSITPPHPSAPHVTIMLFEMTLGLFSWCLLELTWLIDRSVRLLISSWPQRRSLSLSFVIIQQKTAVKLAITSCFLFFLLQKG